MTNPKISIIVPIYKVESTLLRCLDSLKAQTLIDFEVIMVDDGSPDRCGAMIDEYATKDYRFKAFHKPNGGVSSARQFGIDHSIGEFTIHADPDDWVETTMLESLYNKAKETNADMLICDFFENTYKGQKCIKQEPTSLFHLDVLHDVFFNKIHGSTCNKLIRRNVYTDYSIHFPQNISYCEDKYVISSILKNKIIISYLPHAFYHYVREIKQESLSRYYNEQTFQEDVLRRGLFDELLKDIPFRKEIYDKNTYAIISRAFYYGENLFTSKQFKKLFSSEKDIVKKTKIPVVKKSLIYLSCCGYYRFSHKILNLILFAKHRI